MTENICYSFIRSTSHNRASVACARVSADHLTCRPPGPCPGSAPLPGGRALGPNAHRQPIAQARLVQATSVHLELPQPELGGQPTARRPRFQAAGCAESSGDVQRRTKRSHGVAPRAADQRRREERAEPAPSDELRLRERLHEGELDGALHQLHRQLHAHRAGRWWRCGCWWCCLRRKECCDGSWREHWHGNRAERCLSTALLPVPLPVLPAHRRWRR